MFDLQTFAEAALPQKLLFLLLATAVLVAIGLAARGLRAGATPSPALAALGLGCPALGLLGAALNALHMMHTTLAMVAAPTAQMLAPGFAEMAALAEAGAFAGLVAVALQAGVEARAAARSRRRR